MPDLIISQKPEFVCREPGYNSWPMICSIGQRLICTYSKGTCHSVDEPVRSVCSRISDDYGKTWSPDSEVVNTPSGGDVPAGKGHDETGAGLFWIRTCGEGRIYHTLYRTEDGIQFEDLAWPELNPQPMQITDIFHVPTVGLISLWFAGKYREDKENSWGTLVSRDNGRNWKQTVIESEMRLADWATEPSAFYAGDGRIFGITRTERGTAQFQIESEDYGRTWTRKQTNITDICASTPSLTYCPETGIIHNYYYQRGAGLLKRRTVSLSGIWDHPDCWPDPEIIARGGTSCCDSGNVNAVRTGPFDCLAYYAGDPVNTAVLTLLCR